MDTNELTPKPKKRKPRTAPLGNGQQNGQHNGERQPERDTQATAKVFSGNVEVKIWANPVPGGGFSYRFRFCQRRNWTVEYFDGDDNGDAVIAARKVRRWIMRHRWRTFFGYRQ
ncbi:MAG TPA: hypothetical protein VE988_20595 [Gemmataceae bacterium]|nr:hypothetical protein [Gemmataceae bacterium]